MGRLHKRRQLRQDVLHKCLQGNAPRFPLKKRMGLNISDNCLARLSQEIAKAKGATAPTVQEVQKQESVTVPVEEKPKKRRGRKPKAEKAA